MTGEAGLGGVPNVAICTRHTAGTGLLEKPANQERRSK